RYGAAWPPTLNQVTWIEREPASTAPTCFATSRSSVAAAAASTAASIAAAAATPRPTRTSRPPRRDNRARVSQNAKPRRRRLRTCEDTVPAADVALQVQLLPVSLSRTDARRPPPPRPP